MNRLEDCIYRPRKNALRATFLAAYSVPPACRIRRLGHELIVPAGQVLSLTDWGQSRMARLLESERERYAALIAAVESGKESPSELAVALNTIPVAAYQMLKRARRLGLIQATQSVANNL